MKFNIHPLKGANSFEFGMTPDQVRQSMGPNFVLFKRGGRVEDDDGVHPSDYYANEGAFFYYSSDGHLEAIELAPPSAAIFEGVNVFEISVELAVETLRRIDPDIKLKGATVWSDKLGIVLGISDGWYDEAKQTWIEEDDDEDWEPDEPRVGSVLIAPADSLGYLDE